MKSNQQGFTLIELIIVIVILGILAVTASPKFLDLQGDAKASTVQGLSASLKSASNIVYSKALVQGKANGADEATTNPSIAVKYGYPQAVAITSVLDISFKEAGTTPDPDTADWEVEVDNSVVRIYPAGSFSSTTTTKCYAQYTEATSTGTPAVVTPAKVTLATSEC